MSFTFSIAIATLAAAVAGFLHVFLPENWEPFLRAAQAHGKGKAVAFAALALGRVGNALTTSAVGLLMAIFVLGIVGAADRHIQQWTGLVVFGMASIYWGRHRRRRIEWPDLRAVRAAIEQRKRRNPHPDTHERTPGQLARSAVTSPGFLISPMFVAAAGSGVPNVWNATPVIIAYVLCALVGTVWLIRQIERGAVDERIPSLVSRFNLIVALCVALVGLVTTIG